MRRNTWTESAGDFDDPYWSTPQQLLSHYRAAAARARKLQADATTRWVKQHLRELARQWEQLAGEIDGTPG